MHADCLPHQVIFLSARVHPGETPSSFVFDGLLEFLLRESDPRAAALRERYVFKLIPMLNPDGCYRGNYRSDQFGANLNRCYHFASLERQPSIFAATAVLKSLHARRLLECYIDCHAHAGKRGCFLYGNRMAPSDQRHLDGPLYTFLLALNTRFVDTDQCVFYEGASGHAGSGREAVYAATGLAHVFTLECNYNDGKRVNTLPARYEAAVNDARCLSPPPPPLHPHARYGPSTWREVGKGLALAMLDFAGANPASRLGPPTELSRALNAYKGSLPAWLKAHTISNAGGADSDDEEKAAASCR